MEAKLNDTLDQKRFGVVKFFVEAIHIYGPEVQKYSQEIIEIFSSQGQEAAKQFIKQKLDQN